MDPKPKTSPITARRTFSEAEYTADARGVVAHAAMTGTAVVAASDGRPLVVINIPTEDLATFED